MPNRIIKESICVSEQIDELTPFEEIFFYRLLVNCDDYGCMDARCKVLSAKLFPLKAISTDDILDAVDRLAEIGLIGLYVVDDKPYLKVLKWSEHQRVRISKHKYPEPTEEQLAASCGNSRQVAANCGELRPESNPIQSESNPNPNKNPNPNTNPNPMRTREESSKKDDLFEIFWNAYPRKESKPAAKKAFDKLKMDYSLLDEMLKAIEAWKVSDQWTENGGQFIPYPATWLNNERWKDQAPQKRQQRSDQAHPSKTVVAQQYNQRDYSRVQDEIEADWIREMEDWKRKTGGTDGDT